MPYGETKQIILPVLKGLSKIHERGIIHRDIAPDNIMLTENGKVKILDFGAARYATSVQSRSLSVVLKPGYASEEQYRTHGKQGSWTDVYADGVPLFWTSPHKKIEAGISLYASTTEISASIFLHGSCLQTFYTNFSIACIRFLLLLNILTSRVRRGN